MLYQYLIMKNKSHLKLIKDKLILKINNLNIKNNVKSNLHLVAIKSFIIIVLNKVLKLY